jgi:predicted nucleotidyltransferase component of viral defense system
MNDAINTMLSGYNCTTTEQFKNALKEILQRITLLSMARSKFFEHGAFYGGTALRIFYGLERFSEDVDFSLLAPSPDFNLAPYCSSIQKELSAFGFVATVEKKKKVSEHAKAHSAFIKANTLVHLITIEGVGDPRSGTHRNETLKVKIEIDTDPPPGAGYDVKYLQEPIPFSVKLYDQPSMFAGKMHALMCRNLQTVRIKGRDLYDAVWYIGHDIPLNVRHFEARLIQTGHLAAGTHLTIEEIRDRFRKRVAAMARQDVLPFVRDPFALEVWSQEFFASLADRITG